MPDVPPFMVAKPFRNHTEQVPRRGTKAATILEGDCALFSERLVGPMQLNSGVQISGDQQVATVFATFLWQVKTQPHIPEWVMTLILIPSVNNPRDDSRLIFLTKRRGSENLTHI